MLARSTARDAFGQALAQNLERDEQAGELLLEPDEVPVGAGDGAPNMPRNRA